MSSFIFIIFLTFSVTKLSLFNRLITVSLNLAGCAVDKITLMSYSSEHFSDDANATEVCGSMILSSFWYVSTMVEWTSSSDTENEQKCFLISFKILSSN